MVLKLYGNVKSTCTMRVVICFYELGIKDEDWEFIDINLGTKENKSAEHLKIHPFGQIPVLNDDGYIVCESRAIVRYICAKFPEKGSKLVPPPSGCIKKYASFEEAVSVEAFNFDVHAIPAVVEVRSKRNKGLQPDLAFVNDHLKKLGENLDGYERLLSKNKWLAGDEITAADLFHLPYVDLLADTGSDIMTDPSRPNVKRWYLALRERASWKAVKNGIVPPTRRA